MRHLLFTVMVVALSGCPTRSSVPSVDLAPAPLPLDMWIWGVDIYPVDLAKPPDLGVAGDLAEPGDLGTAPDSSEPRDLLTPPADLTGVQCTADPNCQKMACPPDCSSCSATNDPGSCVRACGDPTACTVSQVAICANNHCVLTIRCDSESDCALVQLHCIANACR